MAYDEDLADRIREAMSSEAGVTERRMFGGLGFMVDGHMAVAAGSGGSLMVRADPDDAQTWVREPGASHMVMRGRELSGWLLVEPVGLAAAADLQRWIDRSVRFVRGLPPKKR